MSKVWNFSAGPAIIAEPVLKKIQDELLDYKGSGLSILEMSHRSGLYSSIITEAEQRLRSLMNIPANYHVLFLQGGGTLQFSMVPLNLSKGGKIGFIQTGSWSKKAYQEAVNLGYDAEEMASSETGDFSYIPDLKGIDYSDYDYIHMTSNNTIYGTEYFDFPDTADTPLVVDMSSDILSHDINVADFGLIYAGAQKNIGPAGVTVVIIRDDLIREDLKHVPTYLKYATHAAKGSMYNTPPTFTIYAVGEVLAWLEALGGVSAIEEMNAEKAARLYYAIDQSNLFSNRVEVASRSKMNVTFTTNDVGLDNRFVEQAEAAGFQNLRGHRSVGGMRASIYNAFPIAGVEELVAFMDKFEKDELNV